jgi:hypothetical protein
MTEEKKTAAPVAPGDAAKTKTLTTPSSPTSPVNVKPAKAVGIMRRIRRGLWCLGPDQNERAAANVKWQADAPDVDVCAEAQAIMQRRRRALWCDACNRAVTVEDGVVEFDDEHSAFIVHEDCSNPDLMLLDVDLATLRAEPDRMFDKCYPALREVALRLDYSGSVQRAFVSTRPFPFNRWPAFTMPPGPAATVTA